MRDFTLAIASVAALVPALACLGAPTAADREILRHVTVLTGADRAAGSIPTVHATAAGGDLAAEYIATQFMSYGLAPAGDAGTYFQAVPMTEVRTLPDTSLIAVASDLSTLPLRNLEDVLTGNQTQAPSAYVDAPVVFVGYGIEAPEHGRDDYKEHDLDGKVALLLAGDPPGAGAGFSGRAPTHYGSSEYKFGEAARRGAVAALLVPAAGARSDSWNALRAAWGTARFYRRGDATPRLQAASWIRADAARKLAALAGLDLDGLVAKAQAKDFSPIDLPLRLQAHVASEVRAVDARNVLAVLQGRGARSQEAVLYAARYDRLPSADVPGPDDLQGELTGNATGVAVLLEAARLWSERSAAPARMILFVALAAENRGLPAADYFLASAGAAPPGRMSLALNFEPQGTGGDARALAVRGAARTSFSATVAATAKALGLTVHSGPYPASAGDYDSGAYALALAGVPSLLLAEAARGRSTSSGHPGTLQFAGDARLARLGYELGVRAAAERELVRWLPDDEFVAARKRSQITPHTKPLERKPKRVG